MAVDSASVSKQSVPGKKERIKGPQKKESKSQENLIPSSPAKRNKSAGIRLVGGRIYDSVNGKTCHQCRQKTRDFVAACKNQRNNKPCPIMYCHKCLLNRYGEKAEEVAALDEWSCPKCRDICNCSICMKRKGQQPTGILINTAKAIGYSSVSEMLLEGSECLSPKNVVGGTVVTPKMEVVLSPRKRGKENSFDGKVDTNLLNPVDKKSKKVKGNIDDNTSMEILSKRPEKQKTKREDLQNIHDCNKKLGVLHKGTGLHGCENQPKKNKRAKSDEMSNRKNDEEILKEISGRDEKKPKKARKHELEENGESKKNDASLARRTSPRKLKGSKNMPQGENLSAGIDPEKNDNNGIAVTKKVVKSLENDKQKAKNSNAVNVKNVWKHQSMDIDVDIPLPLGRELNSVAGIDLRAKGAGNALQFLEFCSVFGKILDLKKGRPEHVLQDLLHGRTGRRGKFSLTVQFHIHLLSILLKEQGEERAVLSPSYGKNSWFDALKKCLSESRSILKAQGLDNLEKIADYESFNSSEKLRLLNILCDEVVATEKVRDWMDDQIRKRAEKVKDAKQKVIAAKDKGKSLKQQMKDDIAKAIMAKHGAALSISEHDAIVSRIESEAAQAHADLLESQGMFLKTLDNAVRTEPIFVGSGGHAYWKLNCSGKSNLLHQDIGKGDSLTLDEKWFTIGDEEKEAIEKHISSLRGKRLKASKIRITES